MKKTKTQKGITLVALIITIIVLLILAVVAITAINNDGIFEHANNAATQFNNAQTNEQNDLNTYESLLNTYGGGSTTGTNVETITTDTDYVGSYVDLDNNGSPDGIIYIDKAKTVSVEADLTNQYEFTVTNVTSGLKDYYVSAEDYEGPFGTADVLSVVSGSTGIERFYVMALEDVNPGTHYCWYDAVYEVYEGISDYSTVTSGEVGAGETNTATMLTRWNSEADGAKNADETYADIWGVVEDGWFVPSKEEWAAFAYTLGITSSNYGGKGLQDGYWSSTLYSANRAYAIAFPSNNISDVCVANLLGVTYSDVRLSTTF